jgi:hypothetical protein
MITSDIKERNISIGYRNKDDDKEYISYSFLLKVVTEIKYEFSFYSLLLFIIEIRFNI